MNDKAVKAAITEILCGAGFEVTPLEESSEPTPDLLVADQESTFLIEVKERYGSAYQNGGDYQISNLSEVKLDKISRQNRLSGISRKAFEQLDTHPDQKIFRLIWLVADPHNQHLYYEQFRYTMYGIRLVVAKTLENGFVKEGYYIENSDFYRWRNKLDGVALGNFGGLFINNHSPRYKEFRNTRFRHLFGDTVWDPSVIEESGKIFCLDSDIDRRDDLAVKRALEVKYGVEVVHFENLVRFST
jgi:hypothetical protein